MANGCAMVAYKKIEARVCQLLGALVMKLVMKRGGRFESCNLFSDLFTGYHGHGFVHEIFHAESEYFSVGWNEGPIESLRCMVLAGKWHSTG